MSTIPINSDTHPIRTEPQKLFKPTTLPHGIILDAGTSGAAGEMIDPCDVDDIKFPAQETLHQTHSATELVRSFSQSSSQTDLSHEANAGRYSSILLVSLRVAFYIAVIILTLVFTLAACKFTNFWDPCERLYINTTECKVTSYMKGMIYHTDCTEEHYCILPGFQSNVKRQEWSLHKPKMNDTVMAIANNNNNNQTTTAVGSM